MSDLSAVMDEDLSDPNRLRTFYPDLAAAGRTIVGEPESVRGLVARILAVVSHQYKCIYITSDTYEENSIEGEERAARGTSEHYF